MTSLLRCSHDCESCGELHFFSMSAVRDSADSTLNAFMDNAESTLKIEKLVKISQKSENALCLWTGQKLITYFFKLEFENLFILQDFVQISTIIVHKCHLYFSTLLHCPPILAHNYKTFQGIAIVTQILRKSNRVNITCINSKYVDNNYPVSYSPIAPPFG